MTNRESAQLAMRYLQGYLLSLLLCGLIGCTTAARQEVDAATAPADTFAPTLIAQTDTPAAATATATRPTPPSPPGVSPLQLEPTATSTIAPPTLTPTAIPVPTSSVVPGWLTYENKFLGYRFSYPPEATIGHHGVTGFDVEELPENMTTEGYLAHLKSIYPDNLCTSVGYKRGFLTIQSTDETLSAYASPCGVTGVGDYTIEHWEEVVTIDGQPYTAGGNRLTGGAGRWQGEFYLLDVNGLRIDFGGLGGTEEEFAEARETLLQIVGSLRFFTPQTGEG